MPLCDRPDERHPQPKGANAHPPHDELRVASALQSARHDDVRRVEDLPGGHQQKEPEAERVERRKLHAGGGEERENRPIEDDRESRKDGDEQKPKKKCPHRIAVRRGGIAAPLGLADESGGAYRETLHRGEEEVVHLEAGVRDSELLVANSTGNKDEDGEREYVENRIRPARHAIAEHLADKRPEPRHICRAAAAKTAEIALCAPREKAPLNEHRHDRRIRGSCHAETRTAEKPEDQDRVKRYVHGIAKDVHPEDKARLPAASEIRRSRHLAAERNRPNRNDGIVRGSARDDSRIFRHERRDHKPDRDDRNSENAGGERYDKPRAIAHPNPVRIARAVVLRDESPGIRDDRLEEPHHEYREHRRGERRLQALQRLARKEHSVDELQDGVVEHSERERPDEPQYLKIPLHSPSSLAAGSDSVKTQPCGLFALTERSPPIERANSRAVQSPMPKPPFPDSRTVLAR